MTGRSLRWLQDRGWCPNPPRCSRMFATSRSPYSASVRQHGRWRPRLVIGGSPRLSTRIEWRRVGASSGTMRAHAGPAVQHSCIGCGRCGRYRDSEMVPYGCGKGCLGLGAADRKDRPSLGIKAPGSKCDLITYQAHLARSTARIAPWGACNGRRIGPNGLHDAMSVARIRFPRRCGAWNMRFVRNQEM